MLIYTAYSRADERELLACNGVGPTKLERYGDDILAVLEGVRSPSLKGV